MIFSVFTGVAPEPVQDTPEVAEAKAAHLAAVEAANGNDEVIACLSAFACGREVAS